MSPLLLAWGRVAGAAPVQLCVDLDVDYLDSESGDRWTDDTVHKAARGFRYQVVDAATNEVAAQGFLEAEAGVVDPGCTWVDLAPGSYRAKLRPKIVVDDVEIAFCTQPALTLGAVPFTVIQPAPGQHNPPQHFLVPLQATAEYEQLVAMAYALTWFSDGLQGEALTLCHDDVGKNRWHPATETIWLHSDYRSKDGMVHELGHGVAWYLAGGVPGAGGASQDNCQGSGNGERGVLSKEYTSFVIRDRRVYVRIPVGRAVEVPVERPVRVPVAAVADAVPGGDREERADPLLCDEGEDPDVTAPDHTDGIDWLTDLVLAPDAAGCVGPTLNRSVAWDWVTYWWALYADEGMPLTDLYAVLGAAAHDPGDWDTTGGTSAWTDDPLFRWVDAMDTAGWLAAHQAHADHVDH